MMYLLVIVEKYLLLVFPVKLILLLFLDRSELHGRKHFEKSIRDLFIFELFRAFNKIAKLQRFRINFNIFQKKKNYQIIIIFCS